jgi:asparagine synthase (glutamine-hydrolysing)
MGLRPAHWVQQLIARGPEGTRVHPIRGVGTLGFTRLAINGLTTAGMQPFKHNNITWVCNGEIYNWRELAAEYDIPVTSGSDCEVLGPLYEKFVDAPETFLRLLDGVFALVIVDRGRGRVLVARDPYGVRPLYSAVCPGSHTRIFASELKAIAPLSDEVDQFRPGTYSVYDTHSKHEIVAARYHTIPFLKVPLFSENEALGAQFAASAVRTALTAAVRKRITTTERPIACLLSGGLDSSLVTALVTAELRAAGRPPPHTFSIGMEGSTDLAYARQVAEWLGTPHTEICLSEDEFFRAIPDVIRAIETYDTTTVRASVGNWLVSREIARRTDCKVVFNGDGSDEVWGSYLYFRAAPNGAAFEAECRRLLKDICYFDVLRSDRSISSHGLEPRTPFLDREAVATALAVPTVYRRPSATRPEKWLLRTAFDDGKTLPAAVLWRAKEAFSDGVSGTERSWYQIVQERCAENVPANWHEIATQRFLENTPQTAEQFYYRFTFAGHFGESQSANAVPYFWMPRWVAATDPSARTLTLGQAHAAAQATGQAAAAHGQTQPAEQFEI